MLRQLMDPWLGMRLPQALEVGNGDEGDPGHWRKTILHRRWETRHHGSRVLVEAEWQVEGRHRDCSRTGHSELARGKDPRVLAIPCPHARVQELVGGAIAGE